MSKRWALVCLLAVVGSIFWWSASQARDNPPCEKACLFEASQCIDVCGDYPNPVECESDCRETAEKCRHECRR